MALSGPDVSHHQGAINWAQVRAAGHTFAFAKATEGLSLVDSRFDANFKAMKGAGLVPGAYHFLSPTTDPAAQARKFVSVVGDVTGVLCALDVETTASGGHPSSAMAHAFAAEFARVTGGHPLIVYTGRWYWVGVLNNPHGADIGPLWHSAYTTGPGSLYGGWSTFTFWQYTSGGVCPGVSGRCDLNTFYGDKGALLALAGVQDAPPPSPTPPPRDEVIEVPRTDCFLAQLPVAEQGSVTNGWAWFVCMPEGRRWVYGWDHVGLMLFTGQATWNASANTAYEFTKDMIASYPLMGGTPDPWAGDVPPPQFVDEELTGEALNAWGEKLSELIAALGGGGETPPAPAVDTTALVAAVTAAVSVAVKEAIEVGTAEVLAVRSQT
jgi:GH25 family lysozyme M1 (1,4-beta-N-acetylmuramidase)